jgi:hypothetical protein
MQLRIGDLHNNYISVPDLDDRISLDCGDWSEERLTAFLAETNRKIKRAWAYMADREAPKE